ncbi:hypothetical protein AB0F14_36025 [Streptomyces tubercidicus]
MTVNNPGRVTPEGPWNDGGVVVITGVQAAGKSTVAQALAERLPRSSTCAVTPFAAISSAARSL